MRGKSPDMDIFFILLHHANRLNGLQILFETGKGHTKRCIDVSELADSHTPTLCLALLSLHSFTGVTAPFLSNQKEKLNSSKF